MRRAYLATLRPLITYACSVWYRLGTPTGKKAIDMLSKIQHQANLQISRGFRGSAKEDLNIELFIQPAEICLNDLSLRTFVRMASKKHCADLIQNVHIETGRRWQTPLAAHYLAYLEAGGSLPLEQEQTFVNQP